MEATTAAPKKRILSCIQPSGIPTLGNYLGALKNWKTLADEFDGAFAVADLHAITVRQDPAVLRKRARALLILYIAAGIDPDLGYDRMKRAADGIFARCTSDTGITDQGGRKDETAGFMQ